MAEKTGVWVWQNLEEADGVVEVTQDHLDAIRKLAVCWDDVEHGAPCLLDEDFHDLAGTPIERVVDMFLAAATLAGFAGTIVNRYRGAGKKAVALLDSVPDPEVAALFASGKDIAFEATPDLLALWTEADKRGIGIDPKRPYGSESVSRDVRAIVDPEKKLANAAFARLFMQLESRMMLLLQFFVQNAELAPGVYRRGAQGWHVVAPDAPAHAEQLTREEWCTRLYCQMFYQCADYRNTLGHLASLAWDNRLSGEYADLCRQYKLDNHFDNDRHAKWQGDVLERLQAGLASFPEHKDTTPRPWFTLTLTRIANAQARFDDARDLLEQTGLFDLDPTDMDLATVNPPGVAFLESVIARRGLGLISEDEFQAILAGTHSQFRTPQSFWDFVYGVLHARERYEDSADSPGVVHAQATAAQIELMRGGYDPDQETKSF